MEWLQTVELGYAVTEPETMHSNPNNDGGMSCFHCGARHAKLLRCGKCQVATYCQRECQIQDWKKGQHKSACSSYKRVGPNMVLTCLEAKQEACSELFTKLRFYVCPYAVHKSSTLGRGFLFIQSDLTLATMSLAIPKDSHGQTTRNRAVLVHFLTMGEFDAEVCREDFEMATVRSELRNAVEGYEEEQDVVVLFRFRCGFMCLGKSKLIPDYAICKKLGVDYFAENTSASLQLNIDDR